MLQYVSDVSNTKIYEAALNGNYVQAVKILTNRAKSKPQRLAKRYASFMGYVYDQGLDVDIAILVLKTSDQRLTGYKDEW